MFIDKPTFHMITGPDLPVALSGHSMVKLGFGQAIIGGETNEGYTKNIYHLECSQETCDISKFGSELLLARGSCKILY